MPKNPYIKTIEDEVIEPYFITMDDYCYTVLQDLSKTKDRSYTKKLGHFTKFNTALEKIALHKTNKEDYKSIKEYIETYKEIKNTFIQNF